MRAQRIAERVEPQQGQRADERQGRVGQAPRVGEPMDANRHSVRTSRANAFSFSSRTSAV